MPDLGGVEEIKERIGILDLISPHVALKKTGRAHKGLCPFHNEKTPSFHVFPDKGNYHCFGCGANGDIFTFLMKVENVDFGEALRILAERAGVTLSERKTGEAEDLHKVRLYEVNAAAAQFFNHLLLHAEAARPAREYVVSRGIAPESVASFQLGYALDSWDALSRHLAERGYSTDEMLAAGLLVEREDGSRYDRFRDRLIFPIRDQRGRTSGFGARALGSAQPKYLNTAQTAIFDKGGSLYGIDFARHAIREFDRAVVVEGYVDALMSHQGGTRFVVACLGTSITERQVAILKRLTKHIVLALDPDSAGDEATLRGLSVAQQVFDKKDVPVLTRRGLLHFERKLDAEIRIASLPRGKDPDEVIREDATAWRSIIDQAQPLVDYSISAVLAKADLASAKGKDDAAERLLPLLRDLGPGVERDHYVQLLAQRLRVSESVLLSRLQSWRVPAGAVPKEVDSPVKVEAGEPLEEHLLSLFWRYSVAREKLWVVATEDFRHGQCRQLVEALRSCLERGDSAFESLAMAFGPDPKDFVARMIRHAEEQPALDSADVEGEVAQTITELRRRNLRAEVEKLEAIVQEAEENGDTEARRQRGMELQARLAELVKYEHNSSKARVWRS